MSILQDKIREFDNFASLKAATDEEIGSAEKQLDLKFADDYKEYLSAFGAATFDGRELTGICSSDRLNVVNVTKRARGYFEHFPEDVYVIEEALIDHIITIQKADGTIYSYGPDEREQQLAKSLYEYLFS